jgi:hypothetical protein
MSQKTKNFKFSDLSPLTDLANLKKTLNELGVAVLPTVFSETECNDLIRSIRTNLAENFNVVNPDDFEKLRPIEGGIFQNYGLSLTKEVLDFKTDEKAIKPFQQIWGEDELVMSLDGLFISPPPEESKQEFFSRNQGSWLHTDQASYRREFCCVQGSINLEPIEHGDGCLSVLTNSHIFHSEFFDTFDIDTCGSDWFVLNDKHLEWFLSKGCEWKMIVAPKGSMVFWDSRTIHMGALPREDRVNKDRWRFIIYVCYAPKRLQSSEDAEMKKMAYVDNRCTAHWPYDVNVFPKRRDDNKTNDFEKLSQRHKKFIFGME